MTRFDVGIVGGGPGGYVAAIRGAQLGLKVVLFEAERVGGLCVNWGCIPSKALLKNADAVAIVRDATSWGISVTDPVFDLGSAVDRSRRVVDQLVHGVEGLLKENGVEMVTGWASLKDPHTLECNGSTYEAENVIIATGAATRPLPGVEVDGTVVVTSREVLERREIPGRAVIIGGGPIGVEFAHLWATYGSEVTIVEMLHDVLPLEDRDVSRQLRRSFEARGIRCLVESKVEAVIVKDGLATVTVAGKDVMPELEADVVVVAIGFVPNTEGLNLEALGVKTERGFIEVDGRLETSVPGIYAIGDVTGKLMLAHVASQQGVVAVERIAGKQPPVLDYVQMPRATFCQPQVGSIGYTEQQAKDAGFTVKTGRFPLSALGRAVAAGHTEGFVKVVTDKPTGQVLGIHMIGHDVNDLLGEATIVSLLEATAVEVGFAVHAHPTLAEAIKEAALAVDGEAIHIARRRLAKPATA